MLPFFLGIPGTTNVLVNNLGIVVYQGVVSINTTAAQLSVLPKYYSYLATGSPGK